MLTFARLSYLTFDQTDFNPTLRPPVIIPPMDKSEFEGNVDDLYCPNSLDCLCPELLIRVINQGLNVRSNSLLNQVLVNWKIDDIDMVLDNCDLTLTDNERLILDNRRS